MLMIGFRGAEAENNSEIYKIIKDVKIGGVTLFDYDLPSDSFPRNIINYEQTQKLINNIQGFSDIPLFVSIDAEGGSVNRLKTKYGFLPISSAKKMGKDRTLQTVFRESTDLAIQLKGLGINMNFAPVIDLNININNPVIGALGRSFSSDPNEVINQARVFIENHQKNNIITVEKHFPGHGSSLEDSHLKLVDITNTYKEGELIPYKKLNDEGLLKAVMISHLINKNIDKDYPVTLSEIFLQDILRKQIGFKGLIISDDIQMSAISKNYSLEDSVIMAINAGVNVISILNNSPDKYDEDIIYKVRDIIFNAVKDKKIDEEKIKESYDKIIKIKKEFKIIQDKKNVKELISEIKSKNFELLGESKTLTFGEALDIANWAAEIADIRSSFLLSIFQEELKLEKFDLCYLTNLRTGEGIRISDRKKLAKVMRPDRDIKDFLTITKLINKDPLKTPVTCPMNFGWGGAMGPADFIPSTWMRYKDKVEKITGKNSNPWDIKDSFLATSLYLSESGAKEKTQKGEWNSAMIYFSGSIKSPYTWYADGAVTFSKEIQSDIEKINSLSD